MAKQSKSIIGKAAEYRLASELLIRGYTPSWPSNADCPYDIVLATRQGAIRLQVKASASVLDHVQVSCSKQGRGRYTQADADIIAVWLSDHNLWYFIPTSSSVPTTIYVRVNAANCRWAGYREDWGIFEDILGTP